MRITAGDAAGTESAMPSSRAAEDAVLLRRALDGSTSAWREIVDAYSVPLYRHAWRLLGERDAAEDVVQDTFVKLWRHGHRWQPDAPLKAWLYRVADNLALDVLRRRRPIVEMLEEPSDTSPNAQRQVEDAMELSRLQALVDALPSRQRTALLLCRLEGLSLREAAETMDCTEEAVEALLGRARRTLRVQMDTFPETVARSA